MKASDPTLFSVQQLVALFTEIALAQDRAEFDGNTKKYNRLYDDMQLIGARLKQRDGDQRIALLPLLQHHNAQVRLMAAYATSDVAPSAARATFEALADSKIYPQAANASMAVDRLNGKGSSKKPG